jgi:hypothetical protein
MDTNDFLGSVAQEDVTFSTRIVRTKRVGDNFWKCMIFVEPGRFVNTADVGWENIPGSSTIKALVVTAADYASYTTGVLQSWLYDLFCNGNNGDCILVACPGTTVEAFKTNMTTAYAALKAYAYHKTVCAAPTVALDGTFVLDTDVAVELAKLCKADKGLLSSAPYLPFTTTTPETPSSDALYAALTEAGEDAFLSAHQDATRNGALYSLGLALSTLNGSGTSVGTSMDMIKSANITSSGPNGTSLPKTVRDMLFENNIQTFKPVGDNSGNVSAKGASTLKGDVVQATWIVAYVTYMTKIAVAKLITVPDYLKNENSYGDILGKMFSYIGKFGPSGSGRLRNIQSHAPAYGSLPPARGDQIIIPDAWSAVYVDQIREVQVTGTLYIGEGE